MPKKEKGWALGNGYGGVFRSVEGYIVEITIMDELMTKDTTRNGKDIVGEIIDNEILAMEERE